MFAKRTGQIVDFLPIYAGTRIFWEDRRQLYDLETQLRLEEEILAPHPLPRGVLPYVHPPFFTLFLSPLGLFSFSSAYALLTVLNLLLLGSFFFSVRRRLELNPESTRWFLLSGAFFMPLYVNLIHGQLSFVALLLLSLFVFDLRDSRDGRAGIWAGLLFFKFQLAIVPLLLLVASRRWRSVAVCGGILAAVVVLSFAVATANGVAKYIELIRTLSGPHSILGFDVLAMYNLRAAANFSFPFPWDRAAWLVFSVGVIVVTLLQHVPSIKDRSLYTWAATVIAVLLASPHLYFHDLSLMILSIALILAAWKNQVTAGRVVWLGVLISLPLVNLLLWSATGIHWPIVPLGHTVAFSWLIVRPHFRANDLWARK